MGETLFNTFSFDFTKKKQQEEEDPFEKPKKSKRKKKKPEPTKSEETKPEETKSEEKRQPTPIEQIKESEVKYESLKAKASDLPDPNDPASNFFTNSNRNAAQSAVINENGRFSANRSKSVPSSPIIAEKFKYNRRYMYDSNGDLVSYE
uniref:Uncharacterized protein n=1 Tax=Plectus sambesii TaxID=2011161 RepID=A0A914WAP9_9BILA